MADKFAVIGYKNLKKGGLKQLWEKSNVLTNLNVLKMILSEDSISMIRRGIKKSTEVNVTPEEIVGAIRHILNEAALAEMDKVKICLPNRKPVRKEASISPCEQSPSTSPIEPTTPTQNN